MKIQRLAFFPFVALGSINAVVAGSETDSLAVTGSFGADLVCTLSIPPLDLSEITPDVFRQLVDRIEGDGFKVAGSQSMIVGCPNTVKYQITMDEVGAVLSDDNGSFELYLIAQDDWLFDFSTEQWKLGENLSSNMGLYYTSLSDSAVERVFDVALKVNDWRMLPEVIGFSANIILTFGVDSY